MSTRCTTGMSGVMSVVQTNSIVPIAPDVYSLGDDKHEYLNVYAKNEVVENIDVKTVVASLSDNATAASTGAIQATSGGISAAKDIWSGGKLYAASTVNSTSSTTGAIITPGGIGCAQDVNCNKIQAITQGTIANSTLALSGLTPQSWILAYIGLGTTSNYAFSQNLNGQTSINAPTAQPILFCINGSTLMTLNSTSLSSTVPISAPYLQSSQSGTSFTLGASDANTRILCSNAAPITVTLSLDTTTNFPIGTWISLVQSGAGKVTVSSSATLNSISSWKSTSVQYGMITLVKSAANTWYIHGNLGN